MVNIKHLYNFNIFLYFSESDVSVSITELTERMTDVDVRQKEIRLL